MYTGEKNRAFFSVSLLAIILVFSILSGCASRGVEPEISSVDLETVQSLAFDKIVLTKLVTAEKGEKLQVAYAAEKYVETISESNFGKENKVANLNCVLEGIQAVSDNYKLISTADFWGLFGDKDSLKLSDVLQVARTVLPKIDYLIVAYHQIIEVESFFMEALVEGGVAKKKREVAAAAIIDVKNKRFLNAVELTGKHHYGYGHLLFVVPLGFSMAPSEDLCSAIGKHAANIIVKKTNKSSPKIAVVAASKNPFKVLLELPASDKVNQLKFEPVNLPRSLSGQSVDRDAGNAYLNHIANKAEEGDPEAQLQQYFYLVEKDPVKGHRLLCASADQAHPEARYRLGLLYESGIEGYKIDLAKAYVWYALASKSGHYWSNRHAIRIKKKIINSPAFDAAELELKNWKPGQCQAEVSFMHANP